ncbi:trypco2 family protein [Delftia sp. HK171]|uniref:trypco2 family protein n=1 Tax=Delftia sp. HK171 TaxID=1920191 RepID=UPI00114DBC0D|nr:trypco2 family protein [Delftia sp. HK171]
MGKILQTTAIAMSVLVLTGCHTMQRVPEPTADLGEVLEALRKDIYDVQTSSPNRPANLAIKTATVVLKITATQGSNLTAGVEKAPVKLSYTRTTSGTLENTITLELTNPCTQDSTVSAKDGAATKVTCLGGLDAKKDFTPAPVIMTSPPKIGGLR